MNAHAEVTSGVKCAEGTGAIAALKVNSERRNMGLGRMMRVGLATSEKELPASDRELRRALEELGLEAMAVIWADEARDWSEFDAVIVRSCWNYHLHAEKFLAWIAKLEIEGVVVVMLVMWCWSPLSLLSIF